MRIGIDVSQIVYETGVSHYVRNVVQGLLDLDQGNEYVLYGGSLRQIQNLKFQISKFRGNFMSKVFPVPPVAADLLWNRLHLLPIERLIGKIDVFHSSDWSQPPSVAWKVTTVHDLAPVLLPKFTNPQITAVHKRRLYWVRKEAGRIIVPSEATKQDLIKLNFDREKIRVISEAPDPIYQPAPEKTIDEVKRKFGIRSDYLIGVGVNERKNTGRVIEAYQKIKSKNLKLVLVGRKQMKLDEARGVIVVGHVKTEEIAALYSGARALVYPSLNEGFGLPILEAMACGTPVVTSNLSSMPEVAGGAAVLVDPYDVNAIAEGVGEARKRRRELVRKGKVRARGFSWEKAARETLEVYAHRD